MGKIPVLIARGPNDINVPCRFFNCSIEDAKIRCDELLHCEGEPITSGYMYTGNDYWEEKVYTGDWERFTVLHVDMLDSFKENKKDIEVVDIPFIDGKAEYRRTERKHPTTRIFYASVAKLDGYPDEELRVVSYQDPQYSTRYRHEITKEVFTNYYDGCGGVYSYELTEIECDSAFVGWDLD